MNVWLRECMAFAESKGLTVLKSYIDRAISSKNADNRPEFQQMIKDSGKKMFEVILVWKLDRFARSRFDSAHYKHILKKNKKAPARHKATDDYILTTKLHCGKCGAYMTGESGTSHTAKVHRYYKCFHTGKPRICDKKNVKKEWIENIVINQTMKVVMDDTVLERMANAIIKLQGKENTTIPVLKKHLGEAEKNIENMLNAIQAGIFTESTKKRLDDLEERKGQLNTAILQEELQRPMLTKEQLLFWLHKFRTTDIADKVERQRLIDSFVHAVYLYDDKIVLVFNYKDGTKTVSLAEVEGSDLSCNTAPQ